MLLNKQRLNHRNLLLSRINYHRRFKFTEKISHRPFIGYALKLCAYDKVALRPEILQEITPRQFEELVCELFERKGYNVQLTKQTRDGGKDLIVLNNSVLGDLVIYAECKKKAPKHPVNVGLVRQLYGTVEADRVTAGIMVTNSYFSKDARRFQQTIKSRMNLMDYSELMKQIMDCR